MPTIKARLLDLCEDFGGYITYIFEDLDYNASKSDSPYLMVTRFPNWQADMLNIGDIGFLNYEEVYAGKSEWWDALEQQFHKYKYTNIVFMKFVKERKIDLTV